MIGDEKWLDKQLAKAGTGKYGWAPVNGSALMMLLSIVSGRLDCDLGFVLPVRASHRARAKKILLNIVDWFEKTPPKEVDRLRKQFYADLEKKFGLDRIATVDHDRGCCGKCKKGKRV